MQLELLQIVLDNTSEAIVLYNKEFKVLAINSRMKELYRELSDKDIDLGYDMRQYLNATNERTFHESSQKAINGQKQVFDFFSIGGVSGKWLNYTVLPVYERGGHFVGVMWIIKDIHAQKMLELQLREDEGKFRSLFEEAPMSVLIVDEKGIIIEANKETSTLFGYDAAELMGQSINMLIPERFRAAHNKYQVGYMEHPRPYRMGMGRLTPAVMKSGEEIMVEVSLNSFVSFDKKYATAIIQNVSERIENEKRVKEKMKQLRDIAWFQSHKLRHPLVNIMGLMNLMKEDKAYSEQILNFLEIEVNALDQVIHTVVDMVNKDHLQQDEESI